MADNRRHHNYDVVDTYVMAMPFGTKMNLVKRKSNMEDSRITICCAWPGCTSSISVYRSQGAWGVGRKGERRKNCAYCPSCRDKVLSVTGQPMRMNGFGRVFANLDDRKAARIGNSDALRTFLLVRQKSFCASCSTKLEYSAHPKSWQVDHITPVAIGGDSSIDNLQALCTACHKEKSSRELNIVRPLAGKTSGVKQWMTHYHKDQIIKSLQHENARMKSLLASYVNEEEMAG